MTFLAKDIENIQLDGEFDDHCWSAILMHLRSPTVVLHQLARQLRPGGIVAFWKLTSRMQRCCPPILPASCGSRVWIGSGKLSVVQGCQRV